MRRWLPWLTGALSAGSLAGAIAAAQPSRPEVVTLPVAVTVAVTEDGAAVSDAWVDAQLAQAVTLFRGARVAFVVASRHTMGEAHARMEDRRDRHRLGHLLHEGVIDVFAVASLRDVDEPDRFRQGVHWRPRGAQYDPRAHYVIISAIAGPTVLAHELGHYFGNGHSDVPGNIMSYERGDGPPSFDEEQEARIRFSLGRFVRRGELAPAEASSDDAPRDEQP